MYFDKSQISHEPNTIHIYDIHGCVISSVTNTEADVIRKHIQA